MALFTATVTGNWNGAATWGKSGSPAVEGVDYPGNGDTFQVNAGITVTVNGLYPASGTLGTGTLKTGTPGGCLKFSRTADTQLLFGNASLVLEARAELDIGKVGDVIPSPYVAKLIFTPTSDNSCGLDVRNTATNALVNLNGDPAYFGSILHTTLQAAWSAPASGNSTLYVKANVSTAWLVGQELVIHKGGNYTSIANDFCVVSIQGTPTWDGSKTTIPVTVLSIPGGAATFALDGDVLHLSRNVRFEKAGYTKTPGNYNTNRAYCYYPYDDMTDAISVNCVEYGGIYNPLVTREGYSSLSLTRTSCVSRNCTYGTTSYTDQFGLSTLVNCILFSCNYATLYNKIIHDSFLVGCNYGIYGTYFAVSNTAIFGCNNAVSFNKIIDFNNCSIYANYQVFVSALGKCVNCSIGYDWNNLSKLNTYIFENRPINALTLVNPKIAVSNLYYHRGLLGDIQVEDWDQTPGDHRFYQVNGDCFKLTANGSGTTPTQRKTNDNVIQVVTVNTCAAGAPTIVLKHRAYCPAGVTKKFRYYVQTDYVGGLTSATITLTANYLTGATSRAQLVSTQGVAVRASQSDWSQYVDVEVTPAASGLVDLQVNLMAYQSGKSVWLDPLIEEITAEPLKYAVIWSKGESSLAQMDQTQAWLIADAVWEKLASDAVPAGSYGQKIGNLKSLYAFVRKS